MSSSANDFTLGSMLVELGVVREIWIQRGLALSKHTGLPIGKSLVLLDCLKSEELDAAVQAQSMLRDRLLDKEIARQAFKIVRRKSWSLADALIVLGVDAHAVRGTRLGELLHDSGVVDSRRLDIVLHAQDSSGLPLGRVLLLLNQLSVRSLQSALKIQREIRMGLLDRERALELLQSSCSPPQSSEVLDPRCIRFGELLVVASVLTARDIIHAIDVAAAQGRMIGEVLMEQRKISEHLLVATLRLQDMLWKGELPLLQAADILASISRRSLNDQLAFLRGGISPVFVPGKLSLYDFLVLTGYLSGTTLRDVTKTAMTRRFACRLNKLIGNDGTPMEVKESLRKGGLREQALVVEILVAAKPYDADLIRSAVILHALTLTGRMKLDQALVNFSFCRAGLIKSAKTA